MKNVFINLLDSKIFFLSVREEFREKATDRFYSTARYVGKSFLMFIGLANGISVYESGFPEAFTGGQSYYIQTDAPRDRDTRSSDKVPRFCTT